jgi:hypothetical protein
LTYHFITVPFLLLHWVTNNDICALTLLESKLTGVKDENTFVGRIVQPIYNAHLESKHYYWISIVLFAVTAFRLHYQYDYWFIRFAIKIIFLALLAFKNKMSKII